MNPLNHFGLASSAKALLTPGSRLAVVCLLLFGALGPPPAIGVQVDSGGLLSGDVDPCFPITDKCPTSPVIIDVEGDGFDLTDVAGGVRFDINADGIKEQLSWTAVASDDSFLALDHNANGLIDSGVELFGNFTPQPSSSDRNGFLALAEHDKAQNGGDDDGVIDSQDEVFPLLRLWRDENHNGISEPDELKTLSESDIAVLHFNYKTSKRVDEHGNAFLYRAKVRDANGAKVGRWAWDVFLLKTP